MRFSFLIFILALLLVQNTKAAELKEWWTSARAMGMGNAYTSVVRDGDAVFFNPAALARVSGFHWTALDPRVGIDRLDAMNQYQSFKSTPNIANYVEQHWGDQYWAGGGAKSIVYMPYFSFGAFANSDLSMFAENPANPVVNLDYSADYGFVMGGAFDLVPSIMSIGVSGKRITRVGTSSPLRGSTMANMNQQQIEDELKNRGSGYGLDVGLLFTAPAAMKPSFSAVYKNIGYTTFNHEDGNRAPARIDPELSVGGSLEVDAVFATITPSVEYQYANEAKSQIGKKLHLGVELQMPLIDIRAGLNQGYYALGAGLDFGVMRIDAATYGVELGSYPGQLEDRRYMAQVTFDIGFDIGNFSGKDSKTGHATHLKRRR